MSEVRTRTVTAKVPARLDRLPWSRWHWMIVTGLGAFFYAIGTGAGGMVGTGVAAQEARYRDAALIAVMAYGGNSALGAPGGRPAATPPTGDDERIAAQWALGDALADALGDQAERVDRRAIPGAAGRNLVEVALAAGAQLLVLAGGGRASMLPGTTSQYVLRKAPCPVLIVPDHV